MGRVLLIEAIRHDCRHAPAGKTAQTPQDASKTSGPKHGRLTLAGNRWDSHTQVLDSTLQQLQVLLGLKRGQLCHAAIRAAR